MSIVFLLSFLEWNLHSWHILYSLNLVSDWDFDTALVLGRKITELHFVSCRNGQAVWISAGVTASSSVSKAMQIC
jgi:hypothetical protein